MFCSKCGNKLNDNEMFCGRCGTKKDNIKINFLLNNLIVLLLFATNMCLLFLGIIISLFKSLMDSSIGSGWFLIIIPIVAVMFVIPQFIGTILSIINLKIKNYIMLIFIFIVSIISLIATIKSSSPSLVGNNGILFWICLILNILLCIIILLKLILKIKK